MVSLDNGYATLGQGPKEDFVTLNVFFKCENIPHGSHVASSFVLTNLEWLLLA